MRSPLTGWSIFKTRWRKVFPDERVAVKWGQLQIVRPGEARRGVGRGKAGESGVVGFGEVDGAQARMGVAASRDL